MSSPPIQPAPPALRVRLDATRSGRGMLDGGWWPRSKDPLTELPALIAGLSAQLGQILRVSLNTSAWDSAPRRLNVGGRLVRLGWFTVIDPDTVSLTRAAGERITLLVVPPQASPAVADAAMAMAADDQNRNRPAAILAASRTGTQPATAAATPSAPRGDQATIWENDGGSQRRA